MPCRDWPPVSREPIREPGLVFGLANAKSTGGSSTYKSRNRRWKSTAFLVSISLLDGVDDDGLMTTRKCYPGDISFVDCVPSSVTVDYSLLRAIHFDRERKSQTQSISRPFAISEKKNRPNRIFSFFFIGGGARPAKIHLKNSTRDNIDHWLCLRIERREASNQKIAAKMV